MLFRSLVDLGGSRRDLVISELADRSPQLLLLLGELVLVEIRITDCHTAIVGRPTMCSRCHTAAANLV